MRRIAGRSRREWRAIGHAIGAVCVLAVGAGCGADPYDGRDGAPPPTRPPAGQPVRTKVFVQALDNSFRQRDLTVEAGTEVVWTNVGRNDHDVIPTEFEKEPEAAPWGVVAAAFQPQQVFSHVFDAPGVYPYVCTIHGVRDKGMAGTITVTG